MPYRSNDKAQSAFTIEDRYKEFSQLLIQSGYKNASSWSNPTYHIEVNTSDEGLLSAFSLSPNQVNKVCAFMISQFKYKEINSLFSP